MHMFQRYAENTKFVNRNLDCLADADCNSAIEDDTIASALGIDVGTATSLRGLFSKISMTTMSTAYSGIDAPGTAILNMLACAESEFHATPQHPEHLFAIEWDERCQRELQKHPSPAGCIFTNLEEFLRQPLRGMLKDLVETGKLQSVLQPVIFENPTKAVSTSLGVFRWNVRCLVCLQ